jgi:hypothetical protein
MESLATQLRTIGTVITEVLSTLREPILVTNVIERTRIYKKFMN